MNRRLLTLTILAGAWLAAVSCQRGGGSDSAPARDTKGVDIDKILADMTVEEKVGQLFVVAGNANTEDENSPDFQRLKRNVTEQHVGGIIWFRSKVHATALLTTRLQSLAKVPILVSADLEAGMGMRFDETPWAPWAMAVAATGDVKLAEQLGYRTAVAARTLGVAQIYAPVADVNIDPDNPVINTRSFGEDPEEVSKFVVAFCQGCDRGGALPTVKHFPGHGDTATDSHRSLPVIGADRARLDKVELLPFRRAFDAGCGSVMVGHIGIPALDPTPVPMRQDKGDEVYGGEGETNVKGTLPATVSPAIVSNLLRKEMGFDGLVVTDAMDMGGLADHFDAGEGAIRAIVAGCDQILKSGEPEQAMAAVVAAVKSGRIPMSRIDESARRVLRQKAHLGLFDRERAMPRMNDLGAVVFSKDTNDLIYAIARKSITLVRDGGTMPLKFDQSIGHVIVTDENTKSPPGHLSSQLSRVWGRKYREFTLGPDSSLEDANAVVDGCQLLDVVIVSFVVRARTGAGTLAVPPAAKALVKALTKAKKPVIGVSLGSPYVIREVPELDTYLVAYGSADCSQLAALAAMQGNAPITGRLPVTIPGIAPRGTGIRKGARK